MTSNSDDVRLAGEGGEGRNRFAETTPDKKEICTKLAFFGLGFLWAKTILWSYKFVHINQNYYSWQGW